MKYTLIAEEIDRPYTGYTGRKHTLEFVAEDLTTLLSMFEDFLKGQGFYINGYLDVVSDDEQDFSNDEEPVNSTFFDANTSDSFVFPTMNDHMSELGNIYISNNETVSAFDFGGAQPTINLDESIHVDKIDLGFFPNTDFSTTKPSVCPVCKLKTSITQAEGFVCFDTRCGMKKE